VGVGEWAECHGVRVVKRRGGGGYFRLITMRKRQKYFGNKGK
jgi:transcriptional regulator CtsR